MKHRSFGAATCLPPLHSGGRHARYYAGQVEFRIMMLLMLCFCLGVVHGLLTR